MKKRYVGVLCLFTLMVGFVIGVAIGGVFGGGIGAVYGAEEQRAEVVGAIANHSDAQLTERDNGDVVLLIPNKTESTGYQPIIVDNNSTDTEVANNTTGTENESTQLMRLAATPR